MSKLKMAKVRLTTLNVFFYIIKVMEGVDCLDQNISSYMRGYRSKKWWWPVFWFCLDLSVNNAYQLYHEQKRSEGEHKLDFLGFRRSFVDTYYRCLWKSTTANIFPLARTLSRVSDEVRYDAINRWIDKGKERRYTSYQKATLYFCKKCNVGLHPHCDKQFHLKK